MTDVYSTVPTAWLLAAEQAFAAGGPAINLGAGTLKVGDGNGVVPTASAIIANGGVLHQVWQGPVNGGQVDPSNALQIDINCLIPTVDSTGAEIGPFTVREFAIYDATGNLALVGTTNLPKTVSSSGQVTTLQWWACYASAVANSITVQPPAGSFPTLGQIQSAIAGLLSATPPLAVTPTLQSSGWTDWLISIASATQAALGIGRPATDAEFAAGAAAAGGFQWPWPTLQQVKGAVSALQAWASATFEPIGAYLPIASYVGGNGPRAVNVTIPSNIALSNGVTATISTLAGTGNSDVTVAGSSLTINNAGLYHIDFGWGVTLWTAGLGNILANGYCYKNGSTLLQQTCWANYLPSPQAWGQVFVGGRTLHLLAGDVLTFSVYASAQAFTAASVIATDFSVDITRLA